MLLCRINEVDIRHSSSPAVHNLSPPPPYPPPPTLLLLLWPNLVQRGGLEEAMQFSFTCLPLLEVFECPCLHIPVCETSASFLIVSCAPLEVRKARSQRSPACAAECTNHGGSSDHNIRTSTLFLLFVHFLLFILRECFLEK